MTVHMNVWGTRPTMHMHAWADGGGSYASVIELDGCGMVVRVTLIGDTVETYRTITAVDAPAGDVDAFTVEFALADDYAGAGAADARAVIPLPVDVTDNDYVIVSHGRMYAVRIFGTPEDN